MVLMGLMPSCGGVPYGAAGPCLPGSARGRAGSCVTLQVHRLPFQPGYTTQVTQGYHGGYSHVEAQAYAVDFGCEQGEKVVASRGGVVWDVREDSRVGCLEERCLGLENYVVIDHGDGTRTGYHHLAPYGALVEVGAQVCAGELIGLCGSSGYSGAAHVHWTLNDLFDQSMPAALAEAGDQGGVAIPLQRYRSGNVRQDVCEQTRPSALGVDGFGHQGIRLERPLPGVFLLQEGRSPVIRGRYLGPLPKVALSVRPRGGGGPWQTRCVEHDGAGRFSMPLSWEGKPPGFYHVMLSGATGACEAPGWQLSYLVRLDQSAEAPSASSVTQLPPQRGQAEGAGGRRERLRAPGR